MGKKLGWTVAVIALLAGSWWVYANYGAAGSGQTAKTADADRIPAAEPKDRRDKNPSDGNAVAAAATAPTKAPGEVVLEAKGYIVPRQQILVSPKVSGMIVTLDAEEGRRVEKGDVIAVVETTEYEADFQRAKANVRLAHQRLLELENGNRPEEIQQAAANLREAQAQLKQLEADWKRNDGLRRQNSIAQQEVDLAESKYRAMQQQVESLTYGLKLMEIGPRQERIEIARAEVAQAEAELIKAEWRLGNCTIRAPIAGTILKKNAEEGNIVNPIAFNGSFSVCEMADLSDLEVDLNIQERDISVIQVGQKCRIRAEAYPDRSYEGFVSRLMPIADRAKGAIPVRVKIRIPAEEEGVYLKPEMGAIVTFVNAQDSESASSTTAGTSEPAATPISTASPE